MATMVFNASRTVLFCCRRGVGLPLSVGLLPVFSTAVPCYRRLNTATAVHWKHWRLLLATNRSGFSRECFADMMIDWPSAECCSIRPTIRQTKQASPQGGVSSGATNAGGWLDSGNQKPDQQAKGGKRKGQEEDEDDDEEEEEDPFGLGSIMSKADPQQEGEEEEEEDPFGLGAIMDGAKKESGAPESRSSKRSSSSSSGGDDGGDESRSKKAQKTTGGYFRGTRPATSTQSAMAEAKRQPFQAARSFSGARQGYVFQKGALGLGYYADKVQLRAVAAAAAMAAMEAAFAATRAKSHGTGARGAAGTAASAGARRAGGERKPQTVDVEVSLQKLKAFILKPKKATKAASLMADLMQAQMRPENARMFFR